MDAIFKNKFIRSASMLARELGCDAPIRLLLIDDDENYYATFKHILKSGNYIIDCEQDPLKLEQHIHSEQYDLYFIDVELKGISGIEYIKNLQMTKNIVFPFVFITQHFFDDSIGMECNCLSWIVKSEHTNFSILDKSIRYSLKSWYMSLSCEKCIS